MYKESDKLIGSYYSGVEYKKRTDTLILIDQIPLFFILVHTTEPDNL